MCVIEKKNWKQDWKMATYPWTESLYNSRGSISYSTLGVCNMWKTLLGGEINFRWHHGGQNVISGKENFEERVLKGVSNPGGHHGIAPLGKCHCTFLMPVFCLQFSRIQFSTGSFGSKNLFQSILWCISLTASSQHLCHYRLESKTIAVDFFTLRTLLYPCWTQTSFHRLKWVQFPLTSNF